MNLIREVLDNQIVDRNRRRLGKIDGIVVEFRPGRPPRLKCIETGWSAKARRIHPRLAEWIRRWASAPFRIEWGAIREVGVDVEVALEARATPLLRTENRLRRVLTRIPGA